MKTGNENAKLKFSLSMLIFGTMGIFVRNIPLPSSVIAMLRGTIGLIFMLIVCGIIKKPFSVSNIKKNLLLLLVSGAALALSWIFLYGSYARTTIATATLSYYFAPVFLMIASPILMKERLTFSKVACVFTAILGMGLYSGLFTDIQLQVSDLAGIWFGLLAAVSYATLTLTSKFLVGISAYETTLAQLGIASVVLLPYVLLTGDYSYIHHFNMVGITNLLIVGIFHTGVTFFLYFSSLKDIKTLTVAVLSYIDPLTAVLSSALILQEPFGSIQVLGTVLILGSTLVNALWENRCSAGSEIA